MKNLLGSALLVLLLASSCGTKPAENTAAAAPAATNQPATPAPAPAPAALDASKAPIFNAEATTTEDVLIFSEVMDISQQIESNTPNPQAAIKNNIAVEPFAGQQLDNIEGDVIVYTLKDGGKYTKANMMLNKTKMREINLRGDKMEKCGCGDVVTDGKTDVSFFNAKTTNNTYFYFSTAKNKWGVMKPKENIPTAEVQKQMFEECLAQAETIKEFAKTAKAPVTK
jgi:hypothetical protein